MALEDAYDKKPNYIPTGGVPRMEGPAVDLSTVFQKPVVAPKHSHYFKDVSRLQTVDVYRVLELFNVTNPSIAHAVKKLLVAGGRGAGKDITQDIKEAVDSLNRWLAMRQEDGV